LSPSSSFHEKPFTREPKIFDMIQTAACAGRDDGVRPVNTGMITECAADSRRLPEPDTP